MREAHHIRISTRERLWLEQGKKCIYCGKRITKEEASLDHVVPVMHLEEISHPENLVVCCKRCNKNKGNHIIFTNLYDKIIYPMIDIPYYFQYHYIVNKNKRDKK